jgi:hypothetical protein
VTSGGTWSVPFPYGSEGLPAGTRRVGRAAVRWLRSVQEDLKRMGVINGEKSEDQNILSIFSLF